MYSEVLVLALALVLAQALAQVLVLLVDQNIVLFLKYQVY